MQHDTNTYSQSSSSVHNFWDDTGTLKVLPSLEQYHDVVAAIRDELKKWAADLPTYTDVLDEIGAVLMGVLQENVNHACCRQRQRQDAALAAAADDASVTYKTRVKDLEESAQQVARRLEAHRVYRLQREAEEQRLLAELKAEIQRTKVVFEERDAKATLGNDRIQALYSKSREYRQVMASREDVEKDITSLLAVNEDLTREKTTLLDSVRTILDSIDPSIAEISAKDQEAQQRIHHLNNKRLTVKRHVSDLNKLLMEKENALKELTHRNEVLCQQREEWAAKLAAIEAEALRDHTPRPDWQSRNTFADGVRTVAPAECVPSMAELIDVRSGMSSTQIVDAALKKLSTLSLASKRSVEELLRLSVVIGPVVHCVAANTACDAPRTEGECDNIVVAAHMMGTLPIGLVLPPGAEFADIIARLAHVNNHAIVFVDPPTRIGFRNERWTQAATERHAISMMTALPQVSLSSNVLSAASTPLQIASETLAKWCSQSPDREPSTGFGANLLTSLKVFSRPSAICRAALGIAFGTLPIGFGDQVIKHVNSIALLNEGQVSSLTPIRAVLSALTRSHSKDTLFGSLQLQQAKLALAADAATVGSAVKLAALLDITEQKKHSGLFVRCLFSHFLQQHECVTTSIEQAILFCAKASPTVKMTVVAESTLRGRLDSLSWDAETSLSNGIRYSAATTRRQCVLSAKSALVDALLQGAPRFDAQLLRLPEEPEYAPSKPHKNSGEAQVSHNSIKSSQQAKKLGEFVAVEDILLQLRVAPIKLCDK